MLCIWQLICHCHGHAQAKAHLCEIAKNADMRWKGLRRRPVCRPDIELAVSLYNAKDGDDQEYHHKL